MFSVAVTYLAVNHIKRARWMVEVAISVLGLATQASTRHKSHTVRDISVAGASPVRPAWA